MQLIQSKWWSELKAKTTLLISPFFILALWQIAVMQGAVNAQFLPAPLTIIERTFEVMWTSPDFFHNLGVTIWRLFIGLFLAIVIGVGLGLLTQVSRQIGFVIGGVVKILAPIPKIALYPALVLILGFDNSSKITLVALDAIFPILIATWTAAQHVDKKIIWSAQAFGTSRLAMTYKVVLPAILPTVLAGVRVASVIACVVVFLAEMIASTDGLGHMLTAAARSYMIIDMFVPLVWICMLGIALNYMIAKFQQLLGYN